jgi:ABC-type branched-subunit amino acid transport system ATPase component
MTILELDNITKSFDGICAVDDVSMGFEAGKITCLIGPNGAGKTTLFNLITGFLRADGGRISYRGQEITNCAPWRIAHLGVGRLFQDVHIFRRLPALENVMAAFKNQAAESALLAVVAPWRIAKSERAAARQGRALLAAVGLEDMDEMLAEDLSYGQQKLLSIARLLALDADILLLDEPTAGVSPSRIKELLHLMRRLARDGKTIVVIEHNMNVVFEIADWVFFLDRGQVASFGMPHEVLGDPEVRAAYLGTLNRHDW